MKVNVTEVVDHNFVLWRLTQPVNAGWNYLWGSQVFLIARRQRRTSSLWYPATE